MTSKKTPECVQILTEAAGLIDGSRRVDYGGVKEGFQMVADLWNARFVNLLIPGTAFTAADAAIAMVLVKVSRTDASPDKADHYIDMAGYAGLAYECEIT